LKKPATGKPSTAGKVSLPNHASSGKVDKEHSHPADHKVNAAQKPTPSSTSVGAHPTHKTKLQEEIDELYRLSGRDWEDEEELFARGGRGQGRKHRKHGKQHKQHKVAAQGASAMEQPTEATEMGPSARGFDDEMMEMYERDYEDDVLDLFQRSYFDFYDELD